MLEWIGDEMISLNGKHNKSVAGKGNGQLQRLRNLIVILLTQYLKTQLVQPVRI